MSASNDPYTVSGCIFLGITGTLYLLLSLVQGEVQNVAGLPELHWGARALLSINLGSFLLMGIDKVQAQAGRLRTPEKLFYYIALIGGPAGILLGMRLFRHKTRKRSFQGWLSLAIIAETLILSYLYTRGGASLG